MARCDASDASVLTTHFTRERKLYERSYNALTKVIHANKGYNPHEVVALGLKPNATFREHQDL